MQKANLIPKNIKKKFSRNRISKTNNLVPNRTWEKRIKKLENKRNAFKYHDKQFTAKSLAAYLGTSLSNVYRARKNGYLDKLIPDGDTESAERRLQDFLSSNKRVGNLKHANEITWHGKTFQSQRDLAFYLNRDEAYISKAIKNGTIQKLDIKKGTQKCNSKPLILNGTHYPSICSAARALGVKANALRKSLEDGTTNQLLEYLEFYPYKKTERTEPSHLTPPYAYRGQEFGTIRELAEHLGRSSTGISYAIRHGYIDKLEPK